MQKTMLTAVLLATGLATAAALAEEKPAGLTPAEQAEARLVLQTARNLISYGEAKSDPLALVTAAKMMSSVPGGRVLADGESGGVGAGFDVEALLGKAEQAAKGDETILKLAGQVRLSATANTKAICYWEYYCYYKGWCEYAYVCPDGMLPLRPTP
jgi:opacity protein-like surface antigen